MSRWFRFYAAAIRHPKVARLSDKDYRVWTELLSIAAENDGSIPCLSDLKHLLNRRLDHLSSSVDRLVNGGLIDVLGNGYEPHGWTERQYKSDTSTDRVHKHRAKRNVSVAVTETPPDTETDTECSVAKATGASAPLTDPVKVMFDAGVALICEAGGTEQNARSWLGKAKRDHGTEAVITMIGRAKREGSPDPIPFMEAGLRGAARRHVEMPIC